MATSWTKGADVLYDGVENFCKRISDLTAGRFTITPYSAGEVAPPLEVLQAVQNGTVECGDTSSSFHTNKSLALGFGSSVPFGLNAQQQNAWLYEGGGLEILQKIYADFGVINWATGNTGVQMGGWFKRPISKVSDLEKLKMRIPGLGGEVMKRLGVDVKRISSTEVYLALQRGEIDAAEYIGPFEDQRLKFNEVASFYYYPGWWEPGSTSFTLVNLAKWNQLPKEYQEILKTAAMESNVRVLARYDVLNRVALRQLVAGGTKLTPFSSDILKAAQKAAFEFYEESASNDPTFKQVYEPWKTFREQVYQWHRINELSFAEFSFQL